MLFIIIASVYFGTKVNDDVKTISADQYKELIEQCTGNNDLVKKYNEFLTSSSYIDQREYRILKKDISNFKKIEPYYIKPTTEE